MPELRDYQKELLEKIEKYLALKRRLFSCSSENSTGENQLISTPALRSNGLVLMKGHPASSLLLWI